VTFQWSADVDVRYLFTAFVDNNEIDAAGIPLPTIPTSGVLSSTLQQFSLKFNCSDTGIFTIIYVVSFYDVGTNAPLSKSVIYFSKDCRRPGKHTFNRTQIQE